MKSCKKGQALYRRARALIPGGTQLLSKRPEMFLPEGWPAYYDRCDGVRVWDMDGNEYIDMSICGVGACPLGYRDIDVDAAVLEAISRGNMCTLNAPDEVELAELLIELHPWAERVRYARSGGEALTIAVRIARCATSKSVILFCGYHGWHDWYLAANLSEDKALDGHLLPGLAPSGVPRELKGLAIPFSYNQVEGFKHLICSHADRVAAVVMEPVRNFLPQEGFLETIRDITRQKGIVLIFDEVTSGFRQNTGGIHMEYGVEPDIAVFAKGISNGYPMAAIIGIASVMDAAQETFISSTYWTDRIGPSASIATIKKYLEHNVPAHLVSIGKKVQAGWRQIADRYGLKVSITGIPPLSHWHIETEQSQMLHTIITKRMLERGFITSKSFYSSYAHREEYVEHYLDALDATIKEVLPYLESNRLDELYSGEAAHSGFKRLN